MVLQSKDLLWDIDEAESILLETEWFVAATVAASPYSTLGCRSSIDIEISKEAAQRIIILFAGDVS